MHNINAFLSACVSVCGLTLDTLFTAEGECVWYDVLYCIALAGMVALYFLTRRTELYYASQFDKVINTLSMISHHKAFTDKGIRYAIHGLLFYVMRA